MVRVFSGREVPKGYTFDQVLEWMVPAFQECAEYGKEHGVIVGLQHHDDFLKTADETIRVVKAVGLGLVQRHPRRRQPPPRRPLRKRSRSCCPYASNWQIKEHVWYGKKKVDIDLPRSGPSSTKSATAASRPSKRRRRRPPRSRDRLPRTKSARHSPNIIGSETPIPSLCQRDPAIGARPDLDAEASGELLHRAPLLSPPQHRRTSGSESSTSLRTPTSSRSAGRAHSRRRLLEPHRPGHALNLTVRPHASLYAMEQAWEKIGADTEYQKAAQAFQAQPGLSYMRVETQLLRAFEGFPKVVAPPIDEKKGPRVFELRTYSIE